MKKQKNHNQKPILKGIPASPGIAQGKVKIIKDSQDASKFQEGDILVSKTTDPSMVIAMSKSAAIITDLGGLTSHPAIVARELAIPCVVATKKATQILKNKTEVKVDGQKGIIYQIRK